MGYEISKSLPYKTISVETPLGVSSDRVLQEQPVLITILRAGLAMHTGLMRCFDRAESAFVSAYRKHLTPEEFEIYVEYLAAPNLDGRIWIISDPMLATGNSMNTVFDALIKVGIPKKIFLVTALSTHQALAKVRAHFITDCP